jgi:hypothetical protein
VTGCNDRPGLYNLKNDRDMAIIIAVPYINKAYPESSKNVNDYMAYYADGTWTITPRLPSGNVGGGPSADINCNNGSLIKTYITE